MSLKTIISGKDKFTQGLVNTFQGQWDKLVPDIQKSLIRLFQSGEYSTGAINIVFDQHGASELMGETAAQFNKMMKYSSDLSKELGYKFILTDENIKIFDQMNSLNVETLLNTKAQYAVDMKRFAIESQVQGSSVNTIKAGLQEQFQNMGRRLNTEVYTGIRTYESALDLTSMKNGGIERFQYVGPVDGKNRTSCAGTLSDPRNSTGWTAEQVESSETPFIERGGWNCRHRWVAFVPNEDLI